MTTYGEMVRSKVGPAAGGSPGDCSLCPAANRHASAHANQRALPYDGTHAAAEIITGALLANQPRGHANGRLNTAHRSGWCLPKGLA